MTEGISCTAIPHFSGINCTFFLETADGRALKTVAPVPFLPVAGMRIDPGAGDLLEVERVYYCCDTGVLSVDLLPDAGDRVPDYYLQHGWTEEA